jgi:ATP-binding cassette subfamily F protein uup
VLSARGLSYAYPGGKTLFDSVQLTVLAKERVALVGENGAGKSTLLRALAGLQTPDDGEVQRHHGAEVGLLAQMPQLDAEASVADVARSGLAHLKELLAEHERLCQQAEDAGAAARLAEVTEAIEARGGFALEHRVEDVLSRLGVKAREQKVGSLSGGERRRVDLARLLLSAPDVLLLDEPTNHLDAGAIGWLKSELLKWPGAVLFVSHDRDFMDDVATSFLELDRGDLFRHDPPYESFLAGRLVRLDVEGKSATRRARLLAQEVAWSKVSPKARTTKQKARLDRAAELVDKVADDVARRRERVLEIRRTRAERLGKTVVELDDLGLSRDGRTLFEHLSLKIVPGERWGIIGENGCGKTSLLRILLGELQPTSGKVTLGKNTQVVVLDQHRAALDDSATLGDTLAPEGDWVIVGGERVHIATYLESYLFDAADRTRKVGTLSGGEQNRLHLARLMLTGANCLLLDEPTNDLDVTTLGVLEELLHEHEGVTLVVSHDRAFLDRVCTGILAFEPRQDGRGCDVVDVQGDYTHYERTRAEREAAAGPPPPPSDEAPKVEKKPARAKTKTKRSYKEEQEYTVIEEQVLTLEARKEELEALLADGAIFREDSARATALSEELSGLGPEIERLYLRWQELEDMGG